MCLTPEDIDLLLEAINSHLYWQLADSNNRNDGEVIKDTPEMKPFRVLENRLIAAKE